jgi:plasmid maintenance system antidote protein VapI
MADRGGFRPDWTSAPGDTIADILEERSLSASDLAQRIACSPDEANALLQGRLALTRDIASRLETAFGVPTSFWMAREDMYRHQLERLQAKAAGSGASDWLKQLPVKEMIQFGWLRPEKGEDLITSCLRFFGTPDLDSWRATYRDILKGVAFRKSPSFPSQPGAVAAWIRQGELATTSIHCKPWNPHGFEAVLPAIRALTRKKDPNVFLPELITRCADYGVAVGVVRAPSKSRASGATRFLSPQRALLLLSFRYLTDDQFWFTFFHEAAHLLLHGDRGFFLEGPELLTTKEEHQASEFAASALVPPAFQQHFQALRDSHMDVIRFARSVGVSPGIIVGQLQYQGRLPMHHLNKLKRRYAWT